MRPDLPWNVAGIPPEAREAARAAARREGLSVGEWLTRRILRSFSDAAPEMANGSEDWWPKAEERPSSRRDTEEMLAHVSRSESDSQNAYRRIEEQLRTFARRVDATERSQSEHTRAMSKAAAEINIATREHAQAFDQLGSTVSTLSDRIERVERSSSSDGIKDAVRGLHQGLTRVADQMSQTANQSASQISALADNIESVASKVTATRHDVDVFARNTESRHQQFEDRLRGVEKLAEINAGDVARANANATAVTRLEEAFTRLEARPAVDPTIDRRLNGIERTLADVAAKVDAPADRGNIAADEKYRALAQRIDASEKTQRETANELRQAISAIGVRAEAPAPVAPPAAPAPAPVAAAAPLPPRQPVFEPAPPFPETSAFPPNAPRIPAAVDAMAPPFAAASAELPADPFPPMSAFGAEAQSAPQADSFLAAARRSAQAAAAQAEAERMNRGFGGFAWNGQTEPRAEKPRSRYGVIGLVVLAVVLLAVAGILFSQRLPMTVPRSGDVPAAFSDKQQVVIPLKPSSPAGENISAPAANDGTANAVPSTKVEPNTAPSSPTLPPLKSRHVAMVPVHAVPEPKTASAQLTTKAPAAPSQQLAVQTPPQQNAAIPALDRLTQLANSGNAKAETVVGLKYLEGNGVPVNETEAAKWLERASNQGQAVAQYRLGTLYERGRGVPADGVKAIHWYQAAAQAGSRKAMHNLAVAYAQGTGVPKDFAEAARWFSKAAELGLADSQFNLAVLYERGLGVPQSLLDAYKWYAIAAAQGDTESKSRIDAIATQLSADDRAAAQRSADQFKPLPMDAASNVAPQLGDVAG